MRYPPPLHLSLLIATTIIAASLADHALASGAGIRRLDDAYTDAADSFSTYLITAFTPWPHSPPPASPTTAIPTDSATASTTDVRSTTTETPEPSSVASTPTESPSKVSTIPTLSATTSSPPVLPTTPATHVFTPEQQAVQGWSEALKLSSPQRDFSGLASDLVPIVLGAVSIPAALWLKLRGGRASFANYLPTLGSFLFGLGALLQQLRGHQVLDVHGNLSHSTLALSYLTALLTSAACLAFLLWLIVFHPAPIAAMWLLDRGFTQPLKLEWISSLGRQPLVSSWQSIHQWRSPSIDPGRVSLLVVAALTAVLEVAWRCSFVRHYQRGHHLQQASAVMQIVFVMLRGTTLFFDARKALPRHKTLVARLLAIVAVEASLLSALINNLASLFVAASTESPFFRNARALEYLGYLFTSLLSHHACHRLDAEPSRPPTSQRRTWSPSPVLPWPYFVDTPTLGTPSSNGSLQVPFARYHQDSSGNTVTPSRGGAAQQQQQRPRPRPRPRPPNVLDDVRIHGTTEVSVSTTSSSRPVSAHVLDIDFPEQLLSPVSEATALRASTAGSYYTTANESIGHGDGHGDATAAAAARSPTPTEKVAPSPSPQPPPRLNKPVTPTRRSKPWITPRLANLIASSTSRAPTPGSRGRDSVDSMASHGGSMLLIDNFPTPPRPSSAAWSRKLAASLGGAAARGVSVRSARGRGRARSRGRRGGINDVDGEDVVPFPSSTLTSSGAGRASSILAPHPWANTNNGSAAAARPSRPDSAGTHRTHVTVTSFFNWQTQQQQTQHQPPRPSFARDSVVSGTSKTTNLLRSSMGFPATPGRAFFASSAPNTASAAPVPAILPRAFPTTTNTAGATQPSTQAFTATATPAAARYGHERGVPSNASGGSSLALFGWRDSVRDRDVQAIWPKAVPAYGGGVGESPVNPFAGGEAEDEDESEAAAAAQLVKVNRRSAARQLEGEAHVEEQDDEEDHLSASPSHGHSASDIDLRSTQASSSLGWARGSLSPAIASSTPTPPRLTPRPPAAAALRPTSGLASEVAVGEDDDEGHGQEEGDKEAYALDATYEEEDE